MAIRFNSSLNEEMRKVVRNYNRRRNTMIKNGMHNIPEAVTVYELKSRYSKRSDLERELKRLKTLRREDLIKKVENQGGVKAVSWKFKYIKQNQQNAIKYYERELERVAGRVLKYPGESRYIDNIKAKIDLLKNDITYMNEDQFRSSYATISEFMKSGTNLKARYRGFLREVEEVMNTLGFTEQEKSKFFNKFKVLTPTQFLYAYDKNDIIARVYQLYFRRDDGGNVILNQTDDTAKNILNSLMEQADDIILEAKTNVE